MSLTKFIIPTLLVVQMGASAGDVQTFTGKGVDLSTYKTYKMLPVRVLTKAGIVENDETYGVLILAAVRKELSDKGLKEVQANPDLEVSAGGLARASAQLEALIFSWSGDAEWGTGAIATIGRYNKEGTVIVNLVDPRAKKSAWLGIASRAWGKPSSVDKTIGKATAQMFKKYPQLP